MSKNAYTLAIAALSMAAVLFVAGIAGASLPVAHEGTDLPDPEAAPSGSVFDLTGTVLTSYDAGTGAYIKYDAAGGYDTIVGWHYVWKSGGASYSANLDFTYEEVSAYRTADAERRYAGPDAHGHSDADVVYVTPADRSIASLAAQLMSLYGVDTLEGADGKTAEGYSNFVLDFCQSFVYETDDAFVAANSGELSGPASEYLVSGIGGGYEYWKFALETLYDRAGDCEDTSILCAALLEASGLEAAVVLLPGHCVAAVALDSVAGGACYYVDGAYYFYCETTSPNYTVGMASMVAAGSVIAVPDEGEHAVETDRMLTYYRGQPHPGQGTFIRDNGWNDFPSHR